MLHSSLPPSIGVRTGTVSIQQLKSFLDLLLLLRGQWWGWCWCTTLHHPVCGCSTQQLQCCAANHCCICLALPLTERGLQTERRRAERGHSPTRTRASAPLPWRVGCNHAQTIGFSTMRNMQRAMLTSSEAISRDARNLRRRHKLPAWTCPQSIRVACVCFSSRLSSEEASVQRSFDSAPHRRNTTARNRAP